MRRERCLYLGMHAQLVARMNEICLAGADAFHLLQSLRKRLVGRMRREAQRIHKQAIQPLQTGIRFSRHFGHIRNPCHLADTET